MSGREQSRRRTHALRAALIAGILLSALLPASSSGIQSARASEAGRFETAVHRAERDDQAIPVALFSYSESFEQSFGGWEPDHFLYCEPECGQLEWHIIRSTERAFDGVVSLEGYLNAQPFDDGTIWVERPFDVSELPGGSRRVTFTFYLWSPSASVVTWPVVGFIGQTDPETEFDFTIIGETDQGAGWKQYSHSELIGLDPRQPLWVAFGFGATWEVSRTYFMDYVTLTIE